ncbi:MAG: lytic transglycosylase domain-containing protein [Burkholderiales bacterium]|nr:lytic transglycosylase domain-containing protein [Burkholderiales bacterium]
MNPIDLLRRAQQATRRSLAIFVRDVAQGSLQLAHNTMALVGLAVVVAGVYAAGHADLRDQVETAAFQWLQIRHDAQAPAVDADQAQLAQVAQPDGSARATAAEPDSLTRQQANVAKWISRRYRVAPEPIAALVQEAWAMGRRAGLDPTLILAVMAVESSFNPFAQSPVGAQGLMQVMTSVHDDKYTAFGGTHAAFDPISNLRVGVLVLEECIRRGGGTLQGGLRNYVGAALSDNDGGYVSRVLAEQSLMRRVADGKGVPINASNSSVRENAPAPVAPQAEATPAQPTEVAMLH